MWWETRSVGMKNLVPDKLVHLQTTEKFSHSHPCIISFIPFQMEAWNFFFVPCKVPNGDMKCWGKKIEVLLGHYVHPREDVFSLPYWWAVWWNGTGTGNWWGAEGPKGPQPSTRCAQEPGAEETFFLCMMSVLSFLAISQSLSGCQIYCRHKFRLLSGKFIALTIAHDHVIEMKPKVTLFVVTNLYTDMTELPVTRVWTPVPHLVTLNPSIAKEDPVNTFSRCRALLVTL